MMRYRIAAIMWFLIGVIIWLSGSNEVAAPFIGSVLMFGIADILERLPRA